MKRTSLYDLHVEAGARMVDFEGWSMPLQFGSILEEVRTVRAACGLFDLGHMGRFEVAGPDAVALVDRVITNHCAKIPVGAIRYACLCNEDGYPIDDLLVYRTEERVDLVVNASNSERDLAWIRSHAGGLQATVEDRTAATAMLALQGPRSQDVLAKLVSGTPEGGELSAIRYYRFGTARVCGIPDVRVSRTGYTGEDGFEIYLPAEEAPRVWGELLRAGHEEGLRPIGLAARDTLRLEAGMPLYGHEIDETHHPLEAGLAFGVALTPEKGDFVGREALERLREGGRRRLVGITTAGPRVPRQGNRLLDDGQEVGQVCSGTKSPTVGTNIATAYVRIGHDQEGRELALDVRGKHQPCHVRELPFYSRTRKKQPSASTTRS